MITKIIRVDIETYEIIQKEAKESDRSLGKTVARKFKGGSS